MAISWLCNVFGFERHRIVPGDTGGIIHAKIVSGAAMIMLGDGKKNSSIGNQSRSPTQLDECNTSSIYMVVQDVDAHYKKTKGSGCRHCVGHKG